MYNYKLSSQAILQCYTSLGIYCMLLTPHKSNKCHFKVNILKHRPYSTCLRGARKCTCTHIKALLLQVEQHVRTGKAHSLFFDQSHTSIIKLIPVLATPALHQQGMVNEIAVSKCYRKQWLALKDWHFICMQSSFAAHALPLEHDDVVLQQLESL